MWEPFYIQLSIKILFKLDKEVEILGVEKYAEWKIYTIINFIKYIYYCLQIAGKVVFVFTLVQA